MAIGVMVASAGVPARAQLVVGNDQNSPSIWLVDVSGARAPRALVSGSVASCMGLAADDAGRVLYWSAGQSLYKAAYHESAPLTPVFVGVFAGTPTISGLAFDSLERRLIGRGADGLYEVDPQTAACTRLFASTAQDFGGLDYNPADDSFIGANDSTNTSLLPGRGVYRILKPLNAPTFVRLATYPDGVTDVDGLACGDGVAYLVQDAAGEPIDRLNLASGSYMPALPGVFSGLGVWSGGTWAPGLMPVVPTADLRVTVDSPASCSLAAGEVGAWVVRVTNAGPWPAEGTLVRVTLPANAAFVSSTPPTTPAGGSARVLTPGTLGVGGQVTLTLHLRALARGTLHVAALGESQTIDPIGANNQATGGTSVARPAPTEPAAGALLSDMAPVPTSLVPGLGGARIAPGGLGRVFKSESGARWITRGVTDVGPESRHVILAWSEAQGLHALARAGAFPMIPGEPPALAREFDAEVSIRDSGAWAASGRDARGAASDAFVYVEDAWGPRVSAREGQGVAMLGQGVAYADGFGGASLSWFDEVNFGALLGGTPAGFGHALFGQEATFARALSGAMAPIGQRAGNTFVYTSLDRGGALAHCVDDFGVRFLAGATLADAPAFDRVLVVDHEVMVQEGVVLRGSGFTSPARAGEPVRGAHMDSTGTWFARGSNADGTHWVVRSGDVEAWSGRPITTGASEQWRSGAGGGFSIACGNRWGALLLAGATDHADPTLAEVLVLDGAVILRAGDAVDLDGNGVFDDDTYIRGFVDGGAVLDDGGRVTVLVTLRSRAAALCDGADATIGHALLRWPTGTPGGCEPDFTQDGNVDQDDIACLAQLVSGDPSCSELDPDFNRDGNVDQDDIDTLVRVVAGESCV
jgi:uncharacterized repeat protein (TIGR01451 family)